MKIASCHTHSGWSLLELLLVLICVIALSAVLLYSFVTPLTRQVSKQDVISRIIQLTDAAHLWRHSKLDYADISVTQLQTQGLLSTDWETSKMQNQYEIQSYASRDFSPCLRRDTCIAISISRIRNVCQYIIALHASNPVTTFPTYDQCINHPSKNSYFTVVYE